MAFPPLGATAATSKPEEKTVDQREGEGNAVAKSEEKAKSCKQSEWRYR
jgi:hypothetical protein